MTTAEATDRFVVKGGSKELFECRAREVLVEGPARSGKSRGLLEKAYAVALKYPGARVMLARKTRASMSESVLQTLEDHVLPVGAPWVRNVKRSHRDKYVLPNGSEIIARGLDQPERLMSMEVDRIFTFEWTEARLQDHEYLLTRMSGKKATFQQICSDCNPQHPGHWLNQRFSRCDGINYARIYSNHKDNPMLWDGENWTETGAQYMATLDQLTGVRRLRLRDGRWAQAEGIIYHEFDASVHVIDRMPDGWQAWRKYRAIDFGFNDPFVCLWIADSGEALYVYREWYMSRRITEDHAKRIIQLSGDEQYAATVSDHARDTRETLHRHGVYTTPAEKDIRAGIDAVRARLVRGANGQPRIFFVADSLVEYDGSMSEQKRPTCLREEFDSYVWAKKPGDKGAKEEPYDADNHAMDALRYAVMAIDTGGAGGYVGVVEWD